MTAHQGRIGGDDLTYLESATVLQHKEVAPDTYIVEVKAPRIAAAARPGQFVHLIVHARGTGGERSARRGRSARDPLLRRPLSVHDVNLARGSILLLYAVRGTGTALLSQAEPGEGLDIMGPLGHGFTIPGSDQAFRALLVGGGVGIAPMVFLSRVLAGQNARATVLYGASSSAHVDAVIPGLMASGCNASVATLDGSAGVHGPVTDLLPDAHRAPSGGGRPYDFVYTCGPEPMMAAVARWAAGRGIRGEVSLEAHMACGVGACLGCARALVTAQGQPPAYAKVCVDGPVFPMDQVVLSDTAHEGVEHR